MKLQSAFCVTLLMATGIASSALAAPPPCKLAKPLPITRASTAAEAGVDGMDATRNLARARSFLAENAKKPGVVTLPSGVQYKILTSGEADATCANPELRLRFHYEGSLADGTVFDTSMDGAPAVMSLDGLIPGWRLVMPMMRLGDEWQIFLPPDLGYGTKQKAKIPPNSALVFKIKLLGML